MTDQSPKHDGQTYTRRLFGARHPLWGTGDTSRIIVTLNPTDCKARNAVSLPEPGPFTITETLSTPYAAQLAAEDAGKKASEHGVDLRDPLKPTDPAEDQEIA